MTIVKREGYTETFDKTKITRAVQKAMDDCGRDSEGLPERIADVIEHRIQHEGRLTVEQVQNHVIYVLCLLGDYDISQAYEQYMNERTARREAGWQLDELQQAIWERKYQQNGEAFEDWLMRVSGGDYKVAKLIREKRFIFAGRILSHRGLQYEGQKVTFSNCYVQERPEDNLESIFQTAKELARTYSYGGGCGVDISNLRPAGAVVHNSARITSGAVSFMSLYDLTTSMIGQNGRRGALMISIADSHPDVEQFIDIKTQEGSITKANISVRVSNDFMQAVQNNRYWRLHWEGEDGTVIEKTVKARDVFEKLVRNNWDWAEPGCCSGTGSRDGT